MTRDWSKYIEKSPYRNELAKIADDITNNRLSWYDVKRVQWKSAMYRLRKWKFRFLFIKEDWINIILAVKPRWDIYNEL